MEGLGIIRERNVNEKLRNGKGKILVMDFGLVEY